MIFNASSILRKIKETAIFFSCSSKKAQIDKIREILFPQKCAQKQITTNTSSWTRAISGVTKAIINGLLFSISKGWYDTFESA